MLYLIVKVKKCWIGICSFVNRKARPQFNDDFSIANITWHEIISCENNSDRDNGIWACKYVGATWSVGAPKGVFRGMFICDRTGKGVWALWIQPRREESLIFYQRPDSDQRGLAAGQNGNVNSATMADLYEAWITFTSIHFSLFHPESSCLPDFLLQ